MPNSVADEMAYVLDHAEVTIAVVEDQEQVDKLLSISDRLPALAHIIYDEPRGLRDYDHTRLKSDRRGAEGSARERLARDPRCGCALGGIGRRGQGLAISPSCSTLRARPAGRRA